MFSYNIAKEADNIAFRNICNKIENSLVFLSKQNPFIDVDGSVIQKYDTQNGHIIVFNDYEVDAVYIQSEIDLADII